MKTYIDRDDINTLLEHYLDQWCGPECYACSIIQDEIDSMPSANVKAVIHGHWNSHNDTIVQCSHCGFYLDGAYEIFRYCPNCGALMLKES